MPAEIPPPDDKSHAAFVVTGKVMKSRAATMPEMATDDTMILQIETIIKAPAMFASLTGQSITVRFVKLPDVKDGAEITVYANGWIFGETVAVDAVAYTEASDKKELPAKVNAAATAAADEALKERIDSAETAVVGKVIKVEKAELAQKGLPLDHLTNGTHTTHISEHDPNWHEATIAVDEVLKGSQAKEVKVTFPKSDDVRWYKVHKFAEGQQGVWLLQNGKAQNTKGIPPKVVAALPEDTDVLTTLHASDFLPLNELGKVKDLINK